MNKIYLLIVSFILLNVSLSQNLSSYDYSVPGWDDNISVINTAVPVEEANHNLMSEFTSNGDPIQYVLASYSGLKINMKMISLDGSNILFSREIDVNVPNQESVRVHQVFHDEKDKLYAPKGGAIYVTFCTYTTELGSNTEPTVASRQFIMKLKSNFNVDWVKEVKMTDNPNHTVSFNNTQFMKSKEGNFLLLYSSSDWDGKSAAFGLLKMDPAGTEIWFKDARSFECDLINDQSVFDKSKGFLNANTIIEHDNEVLIGISNTKMEATGGAPIGMGDHFIVHVDATNGAYKNHTAITTNLYDRTFNFRRFIRNPFNDKIYIVGEMEQVGPTLQNPQDLYIAQLKPGYEAPIGVFNPDILVSLDGTTNSVSTFSLDNGNPNYFPELMLTSANFIDANNLFVLVSSGTLTQTENTQFCHIYSARIGIAQNDNQRIKSQYKSDFGYTTGTRKDDYFAFSKTNGGKIRAFYPIRTNLTWAFADKFKFSTFNINGDNCEYVQSTDLSSSFDRTLISFPESVSNPFCDNYMLEEISFESNEVTLNDPDPICLGCNVNSLGNPSIVSSNGNIVCANSTIDLEVSPYNSNLTYQWFGPNVNANEQGSSIQGVNVSGMYGCVITDPCGNTVTLEYEVIEESIDFDDSPVQKDWCRLGNPIYTLGFIFDPLANYSGNVMYAWYQNSVNPGNILSVGPMNYNYSVNQPGIYILVVDTDCGTFSKVYDLNELPTTTVYGSLTWTPAPSIGNSFWFFRRWDYNVVTSQNVNCTNVSYNWVIEDINGFGQVTSTNNTTTTTNNLSFSRWFANGWNGSVRVRLENVICEDDCTLYDFGAIQHYPSTSSLVIGPNPSEGVYLLSMENVSDDVQNRIRVFNLQGVLVYETERRGIEFSIDISGEARGVYTIEVENREITFKEKLVKQ